MFATIDTNGATHISIHIPHEGAEKSLPALAKMLEANAVFVRKGYQEMTTVKPAMSITLGDRMTVENYETEIVIAESGAVIGPEFEIAAPDVFVSYAKALKRKDEENSRLRTELSFVKNEMENLKLRIAELSEESA